MCPTIESFRLCEVQVSYKKRPYFKFLETLSGWMYSILTTTTVKVTCPSRKSQTVQLNGVGIVQIAPGCYLRTSGLSLPSPGSRAQTSVVIYEPHLHLNLSELSPALLQHKQLMASPEPQQEPPEGNPAKNGRYKENDETLSKLEDQLNEISSQEQGRVKKTVLTYGSYVGLVLISICLLTYLCRVKLIAVMTAWKFCPPRGGNVKTQSAIDPNDEQAARKTADIHQEEARVEQQPIISATHAPAPKSRATSLDNSKAKVTVRLPQQRLQPM